MKANIYKAYAAICRKAVELGWPEAYRADLVEHDWNTLVKYRPTRFLFEIRDTGTHLLPENSSWARTLLGHELTAKSRFFWWNGAVLGEVDREQAFELLARRLPQPLGKSGNLREDGDV